MGSAAAAPGSGGHPVEQPLPWRWRSCAGCSPDDIPLSGMPEVDQMLVADKVQNRKDFLVHHRGCHPRSDALDRYFRLWLLRLGVTEQQFAELFEELQVTAAPTRLVDL